MRKVLFHQFTIGDCEDPELYAAQPLWEWQQTEHGQWVMAHAIDPTYHVGVSADAFGYAVRITGMLTDKDEVFYRLKYE